MRSAKPSPLTSPAEATEKPLRSCATAPGSLKPVVPSRAERSRLAGNVGITFSLQLAHGDPRRQPVGALPGACYRRANSLGADRIGSACVEAVDAPAQRWLARGGAPAESAAAPAGRRGHV